MKRTAKIKPKRSKPWRRVGRLPKGEMGKLREEVFARSGGICEMAEHLTSGIIDNVILGAIKPHHAMAMVHAIEERCAFKITLQTMHLAPIKSRGASGADTSENTLASCASCHGLQHQGIKPVPPKREVA